MEWTLAGPFVPSGILHNRPTSAPQSFLGPRVQQKVGLGAATIESSHPGKEKAKEAEFNKDLDKAESLFRVLGWYHASEPAVQRQLAKPKMEDLINSLLRRALYIATLKENQLLMFKEAKQYKADMLAELKTSLAGMSIDHPKRKYIQERISELKGLEVRMDPLPEVDWSAEQFQHDGLRLLQDYELQIKRSKAVHHAQCTAAHQAHQRQVLDEDQGGASRDQTSALTRSEIEDLVSQWDYLDCCVEQLGCMSTTDLRRMLRLTPSGDKEHQANEEAPVGLGELQLYDDGGKDDKDEQAKARAALVAYNKAIKVKKVALYRAVAMRQFVDSYDAQMKERRMNDLVRHLGQEHAQHRKQLTKAQQDQFLQRVVTDVHMRHVAKERRRVQSIQTEVVAAKPFRARAYKCHSSHQAPPSQEQIPLQVLQDYVPRHGGFVYWDAPGVRPRCRPPEAEVCLDRSPNAAPKPTRARAGSDTTPAAAHKTEWVARLGRTAATIDKHTHWLAGHTRRVQGRERAVEAVGLWVACTDFRAQDRPD